MKSVKTHDKLDIKLPQGEQSQTGHHSINYNFIFFLGLRMLMVQKVDSIYKSQIMSIF